MADYEYIMEFKNANADLIEIRWVPKGVTTVLPYYHFTGTGKNPATLRYYGGVIVGGELTLNILIRDAFDEAEIKKLLTGTYYFVVVIEGKEFWYGENINRFFDISYKHYPYTAAITVNDRLGTLKYSSFHLSDYPDGANISLLDLFRTILDWDDGTTTGSGYSFFPGYISVATTLYKDTQNKLFEELFVNIKNFLKEDVTSFEFPEYMSHYDILESILTTLNCRLLIEMYGAKIIDNYSYDGTGWIDFAVYDIATGTAQPIVSENVMIDLFANPKKDRFIFQDQRLTFLPAPKEIRFNKNLIPYKTLLPFANNEGLFLGNQNGINLEFDSSGYLRNWVNATTFKGGEDTAYPQSGRLRLNINDKVFPDVSITSASYTYSFGDFVVNMVGIRADLETLLYGSSNTVFGDEVVNYHFELKYTANGNDYYLDSNGVWNSAQTYFQFSKAIKDGKKSIKYELPLPDEVRTGQSLTLTIYEATNGPIGSLVSSSWPSYLIASAYVSNLKLYLIDKGIFMSKFDETITVATGADINQEVVEIDLRVGIGTSASTTNNNERIELSQFRDSLGATANILTDGLEPGDPVDYWLKTRIVNYRSTIRQMISGTIRFFSTFMPKVMIQDYEDKRYIMEEGTFDFKTSQFNGKWKETQQ